MCSKFFDIIISLSYEAIEVQVHGPATYIRLAHCHIRSTSGLGLMSSALCSYAAPHNIDLQGSPVCEPPSVPSSVSHRHIAHSLPSVSHFRTRHPICCHLCIHHQSFHSRIHHQPVHLRVRLRVHLRIHLRIHLLVSSRSPYRYLGVSLSASSSDLSSHPYSHTSANPSSSYPTLPQSRH
jgi:hypothetical protein